MDTWMDHRLLSRNWLKCAKSDCSPNSIQCNHRNLHHPVTCFRCNWILCKVAINVDIIEKNMWSSLFVWDKQKDKQTNKGWSKINGESEILCVLVTPCLVVSQKITNNSQFISTTFTDWFLSRIWFIFRQLHDIHASLWYILANSWNKIRRGVQFSKLCSTIAKDVDIFGIYIRISRFDTNPQIIWW